MKSAVETLEERIRQCAYHIWEANGRPPDRDKEFWTQACEMITADDGYVDTRFDADEKAVVATDPAIVKTPADSKSLLAILRRSHRGKTEMSTDRPRPEARTPNTALDSAVAAVRAIRGPRLFIYCLLCHNDVHPIPRSRARTCLKTYSLSRMSLPLQTASGMLSPDNRLSLCLPQMQMKRCE